MDTRIEKVTLSLKDIDLNEGQIEGLPANPRNWTKDELKSLALSLTETPELFEMRCPIVVPHEGRYVVLGGNLRIAAARENKEKEVTCFVFNSTSIEKMKEIVIKDNGAWGKWDYDSLANEWDDLPLTDWGVPALDAAEAAKAKAEEGEATEDDFDEEIDAIPVKCQRGDVWELGDHRLMCGDSTDHDALMLLVGSYQADCLLTDPPYNVDYVSKTRAINAGHKGGVFIIETLRTTEWMIPISRTSWRMLSRTQQAPSSQEELSTFGTLTLKATTLGWQRIAPGFGLGRSSYGTKIVWS